MTIANFASLYGVLLGRSLTENEINGIVDRLRNDSALVVCYQALASAEFTRRCLDSAQQLHLFLLHAARIKLVCSMLPPASRIVDLGGANGTLHDLGYPY